MQTHNLKRKNKNKKARLVGRGGKRGKTSGRGTKGQNARAGRKKRPEIRDIIKKIPKLRGRGKNSNKSIQWKPVTLNLDILEKNFENGETVSPSSVIGKGIAKKSEVHTRGIKILSDGKITKKLIIKSISMSKNAHEKLSKAGTTIS
ncbi:MAG TPA: uL15 family ribosomal protein [Candidatus Paceibacterota bacterium]